MQRNYLESRNEFWSKRREASHGRDNILLPVVCYTTLYRSVNLHSLQTAEKVFVISITTYKTTPIVICRSLSALHGASSGCGWKERHPTGRVAANVLTKQQRRADRGWFFRLLIWRGANNSSPYKLSVLRIVEKRLGSGLILWFKTGTGGGLSWMR